MLYNPDLYKEPSLRDMADFCESKDPQEEYLFENASICACAQYSHTKGMVGYKWLFGTDHHETGTYKTWRDLNTIAGSGERTFGALAKRLRETVDA